MTLRQTSVITGANSGIGLATAKLMAQQGYSVITICRNKEEGDRLAHELMKLNPSIHAENIEADLSDFESLRKAVNEILLRYTIIDRVINNAGYYPTKIEYIQDIEKTLYTSHLGHMLLTMLLMPALQRSNDARIINVSSGLHARGKISRFFIRTNNKNLTLAYADAKFANILFTMALSTRLPENITAYSLHPGVVITNFQRNLTGSFKILALIFKPIFISPEKGAFTSLYLVNEDINKLKLYSGGCFAKNKLVSKRNVESTDINATWMWNRSMEILTQYL